MMPGARVLRPDFLVSCSNPWTISSTDSPFVSGKNRKTKATIRHTGVENVRFLRLTGFGDLARH